MKLPVIVAMGGINAAGRSSEFHALKRMVYQALTEQVMKNTWSDLRHRMKLTHLDLESALSAIQDGTLVRKIDLFDPAAMVRHQSLKTMHACTLSAEDFEHCDTDIELEKHATILLKKLVAMDVQTAGCLPCGFDIKSLYQAKNHPRGLAMTIYGMSDALTSLGVPWDTILSCIHPDQVSVYAGSALSQIDEYSLSGLIGNPLHGGRVSSKMMPLSLAEMPADFINSYMLNSVGATGHNMGACATFLYNLRMGVVDIQTGKARVVVVGSSEAPVTPEVIEGFNAMGALATDESLKKLDASLQVNHRRACRPFSSNTGFVIAESAQFVILMADDLAIELGLPILGAVADVFVNADGNKKSIAGPGIGNYITMAKAAALAEQVLGKGGLRETYVQAHGTGTPQNRVTESHILNEMAKTFGVPSWKVTAIKSYVGHSIGAAAGDQLMATLGAWQLGILPGIVTIDHIASDVSCDHLDILMQHYSFSRPDEFKATLINSKGFGGNNATALIVSPQQTQQMLTHRFGAAVMKTYGHKAQHIRQQQVAIDAEKSMGKEQMIYHFGTDVLQMEDVKITPESIGLKRYGQEIYYASQHPYQSYVK